MHSIFWFRTRQWVLSRVLHLTEHKKQTLLAAPDAVLLLPALFRKRRISRILLVTTPGFVRRGTLTSLLDGCKKENISVTIFSEIARIRRLRAWNRVSVFISRFRLRLSSPSAADPPWTPARSCG